MHHSDDIMDLFYDFCSVLLFFLVISSNKKAVKVTGTVIKPNTCSAGS